MKRLTLSRLALYVLCGASMSLLVPGLAFAGWVQQNSGALDHLSSVHFPVDALTGYAAGINGKIWKTTNGGANWVRQIASIGESFNSVHFPVDA
jgi:photosystem II stability/assembly factor-like uncharacterized protein